MELIKSYNEENLFKTRFTDAGMVILILLVLALLGLGERVLYDLARTSASPIGDFGYFNNSKVIVVQAVFIVGLLILNIIVNYVFGRRKEKFAIALIPYFITSIILAIQLAIQLGVYFTNHHSNLQFYLVMTLLVVVSSYGIFHIQNNYKKVRDTSQANSTGLLAIFIVVFALFAILILSFNDDKKVESNTFQNNSYQNNYNDTYIPQDNINQNNNLNNTYSTPTTDDTPSMEQKNPISYDDNYPRIMYWPGKVNQHWDVKSQSWMTDADGTSGADIDKLVYCKKFYPDATFVSPYKRETITTWHASGNLGNYKGTVISDFCVAASN